jgi:hypothetical protein
MTHCWRNLFDIKYLQGGNYFQKNSLYSYGRNRGRRGIDRISGEMKLKIKNEKLKIGEKDGPAVAGAWQDGMLVNPKGIVSSSPRLRAASYPGSLSKKRLQPQRGCGQLLSRRCVSRAPQPRWGCKISSSITQGGSQLATLGFMPESRWDSFREALFGASRIQVESSPDRPGQTWSDRKFFDVSMVFRKTIPVNPKGIASSSPRLRAASYPGSLSKKRLQPQRGCRQLLSRRCVSRAPQPRWGCKISSSITQGGSQLATLGFMPESRWDSDFWVCHDGAHGVTRPTMSECMGA